MANLDTLTNLVRMALSDASENENAASLARRQLKKEGLHVADLKLVDQRHGGVYGQTMELLRRQDAQLAKLRRENRFLRSKVDPKVHKAAVKAGEIEYDWIDFEDAIVARLGGSLPNGWETLVAKHLGVMRSTVRRWQEGLEAIPDSAFTDIQTLTDEGLKAVKSVVKPARKEANAPFEWKKHPELDLMVAKMFVIEGRPKRVIAEMVGRGAGVQVTPNQITQHIYNNPPPEGLGAAVRENGQMTDWAELWLIGQQIFSGKKGWVTPIRDELGIPDDVMPGKGADVNAYISQSSRLDELRDMYRKGEKLAPKTRIEAVSEGAAELLDALLEAGAKGLTRKDLDQMGVQRRRIPELQRVLKVFEVSGGAVVHHKFREQYPIEWGEARRLFAQEVA